LRVGDVVLYSVEGIFRPAIITFVHDDSMLNLRVILDTKDIEGGEIAEYWTKDWLKHTGFMPPEYCVEHDAGGDGGTWKLKEEAI